MTTETPKNYQVALVLSACLLAAISFWGGTRYAAKNSSTTNLPGPTSLGGRSTTAFGGGNGGRRSGMGGLNNGIAGEILSHDDQSITVKLRDGGSKIIFFSSSTVVSKNIRGSLNDITTGESITAGGTQNQDGSITAQFIQLRTNFSSSSKQ